MEVEVEHLSVYQRMATATVHRHLVCVIELRLTFFLLAVASHRRYRVPTEAQRRRLVIIFNFTKTTTTATSSTDANVCRLLWAALPLTTLVADIVVSFDFLRCLLCAITVNYRNTHTHVWVCGFADAVTAAEMETLQSASTQQSKHENKNRERWIRNVRKIPAHCVVDYVPRASGVCVCCCWMLDINARWWR